MPCVEGRAGDHKRRRTGIIEGRGSDTDLFREGLPVDGGFGLRMHHVQFRITGLYEDWRRYIDAMEASHPPRLCGGGGELHFAFVDEAERLGHQLEYV